MTDIAELLAIEGALKEVERRKTQHRLMFFVPYPKQREFLDGGIKWTERLFMAGNRVGKTETGAFEMACHLTGEYPEWWLGRRFDRPVKAWAASDTGITARDVAQTKLCGPYGYPEKYGTGMIPRAAVRWDKDVSLARGVTDLFDTVLVEHKTNGVVDGKSVLTFKTYEQGRKKWQGEAVDVIWFDEEPPMDIYSEGLARLAPTQAGREGGIGFMTFTPLEGKSDVVVRFQDKPSPDRGIVMMALSEADHISDEEKAKMVARYPEHEREARTKGIPLLGSGKIFTLAESDILVPPFPLPSHWRYIWGTDFGIEHPFAAALLAIDMDKDTIYVVHCIRRSDATPLMHTQAMKPACNGRGALVPMAWPQDGWQRKEFEGKLKPTALIYKKYGQKICDTHATFSDGSNSTWAGILEMRVRFADGRLKVFSDQTQFLEEYREYHMKDGQIVKKRDDILSGVRVGIMARRFARSVLFFERSQDGRGGSNVALAKDIDSDPFT